MHDIIELGPHLLPKFLGWIGAENFVHGKGFLFTALPSFLGAPDVCARAAHTGVKPACDGRVPDEPGGVPGEFSKDRLGDVLRLRSITP